MTAKLPGSVLIKPTLKQIKAKPPETMRTNHMIRQPKEGPLVKEMLT